MKSFACDYRHRKPVCLATEFAILPFNLHYLEQISYELKSAHEHLQFYSRPAYCVSVASFYLHIKATH